MPTNLGATSLRLRGRGADSMREFDRLPAEVRAWLARATLPWRPRSARRVFERALAKTGDRARALEALERRQRRLVAADARRVWGADHPDAGSGGKA